jgi:hypothetical protein
MPIISQQGKKRVKILKFQEVATSAWHFTTRLENHSAIAAIFID